MKIEDIFLEFENKVINYYQKKGYSIGYMYDGNRQNKHILEVSSDIDNFIFYVKESTLENGFWGLNPKYVEKIEDSEVTWFLVLLLQTSEVGYLLSGKTVRRYINENRWSSDSRGEFKIHESELSRGFLFNSFDEFILRVG